MYQPLHQQAAQQQAHPVAAAAAPACCQVHRQHCLMLLLLLADLQGCPLGCLQEASLYHLLLLLRAVAKAVVWVTHQQQQHKLAMRLCQLLQV
jgi:hypothetical protein